MFFHWSSFFRHALWITKTDHVKKYIFPICRTRNLPSFFIIKKYPFFAVCPAASRNFSFWNIRRAECCFALKGRKCIWHSSDDRPKAPQKNIWCDANDGNLLETTPTNLFIVLHFSGKHPTQSIPKTSSEKWRMKNLFGMRTIHRQQRVSSSSS